MSKVKKILLWILVNGAFGYLAIQGMFYGVKLMDNVFMFFLWVAVILNTFTGFNHRINKLAPKVRSVPSWLSIAYDIAMVIGLAASGRFITAAAWLWASVCIELAYEEKK